MRCFENIAKLIKQKRISHPKRYSQSELSKMLGYKNGQFISNVERALCNIPLKMLKRVSEILDIPQQELKETILKDYAIALDIYLGLDDEKGHLLKKKSTKEATAKADAQTAAHVATVTADDTVA